MFENFEVTYRPIMLTILKLYTLFSSLFKHLIFKGHVSEKILSGLYFLLNVHFNQHQKVFHKL